MLQIEFGDGELVLCPFVIIEKLPVLKALVEQESKTIIKTRSGRLFRQIVDFFFYPEGTIQLTPALITELDFYGYDIIPNNLSIDKVKGLIDFLQYDATAPLRQEIKNGPGLSINIPITYITEKSTWTRNFPWGLSNTYLEAPSNIFREVARETKFRILDVDFTGDWVVFRMIFNRIYQKHIFKQIAEDRAFILRLILAGFYYVENQGLYQYILTSLISRN